MQVSQRDREIVAAVQLMAERPDAHVARQLKLPEYTVRRTVTRLCKQGLLRKRYVVNYAALGFVEWGIFFNSAAPTERNAIDVLARDERVTWITSFVGHFQYGCGYLSRSLTEPPRILSEFLGERSVVVRRPVAFYNAPDRGYRKEMLSFPTSVGSQVIDELDHHILRLLDLGSTASLRELAHELSEAPSTIQYRVHQLRERGVLVGAVYRAALEGLGNSKRYRLLLRNRLKDSSTPELLAQALLTVPGVLSLVACTGGWDYEVEINVERGRELEATRRRLEHFCGEGSFRGEFLIPVREAKESSYPFQRFEACLS